MADDFLLFHWSPRERRESIQEKGFLPGSPSTDGLWNPPHTCWSDSPSLSWGLSGMTGRGPEHEEWDLWTCWFSSIGGHEVLPFDHEPERIKEIRVYEPIPPEDVWYVGTRRWDA